MSPSIAASRDLLFGLLALQNGLINQVQLVAAVQTWTLDKARTLADHLVTLGQLNGAQRSAVKAMAELHVAKHGDVERSLAAISAGRSTHERKNWCQEEKLVSVHFIDSVRTNSYARTYGTLASHDR